MCHRQLADYNSKLSEFTKSDIQLIAASVDGLEEARDLRNKLILGFDLGYGLNAKAVAESTGGFFDDVKGFLHAASFIIDPANEIAVSAYSSGSVGRLAADDALKLIGFLRSKSE